MVALCNADVHSRQSAAPAVNMYSLWIIGPYVEKLYGSARFVIVWVLTGIAGVVASYFSVVSPETSMGVIGRFLSRPGTYLQRAPRARCSGLVGVLFIFGIKFRQRTAGGIKARVRQGTVADDRNQLGRSVLSARHHR